MQGDRTDKRDISAFNTWKDIIIPGNIDDGMTINKPRLVDPLPLSRRIYLANYLGRAQGKAGRLRLIELAKEYPDKVHLPFFFLSTSFLIFTIINVKFPREKTMEAVDPYMLSVA